MLRWETIDLMTDLEGGIVSCFIDWGESEHPASPSPQGCSLLSLRVLYPEASGLRAVFDALGLPIQVEQSREARLIARISCPKAVVELR